ncbi:MAG: hypothetical protein ACR2NP_15830 [Pirellulaceae bacterium]
MRSLLIILSTFLFSLTGNVRCSADEPTELGYERWEDLGNTQSGAVFSQIPESLYGFYTNKLKLFGEGDAKAPLRLIDIEMRYNNDGEYTMNAIWIENEGDYAADSWLLLDLTEEEVHQVAKLPKSVILDIESYFVSPGPDPEYRYAVILRSNPDEYQTRVFTRASWQEVAPYLGHGRVDGKRWRPLDYDVESTPGEYAEPYWPWPDSYQNDFHLYTGVFVENEGGNFMPYEAIAGDNATMNAMAAGGWSATDFSMMDEKFTHYFPNDPYMMIFVQSYQPWFFMSHLTESELVASIAGITYFQDVLNKEGRCVDIEGRGYNKEYNPSGRRGLFLGY